MTNKKNTIFLVVILLAHLFLLVVLKFTAWPEMTIWPYLINNGWLPYQDIAIAHTPLLIVKLAMFYKIFGVGILQLKIFTWILILITDCLIFWIARKLWDKKVALITVGAFAFWQLFFDGNGLWFDLFMSFFALLSYYFVKQKKYFWTAIFWTLAFISKQTAVWFLIPIGFFLLRDSKFKIRDLTKAILGSLLILLLLVIPLLLLGILPSFYNWAIHFGVFVLPKSLGQIQLPDFKNIIVTVFPFLIFIPLFVKSKLKNLDLLIWSFAGIMGAYPRFEYFHIQPAIPFLAIATGLVFINLERKNILTKLFIPIYITGSIYLFAGFFMRNFNEGTRFYESNVQNIVAYVKSNTNQGDMIFVMNWWDNIYALTNTLPATRPWIPQLSWYQEIPGIQEKEIVDLENSKPKLILLQKYSETGLSAYKPQKIYDYVMLNYKLKEKIDGIEILILNK